MLEKYTLCQKSDLRKILSMLYDSNGLKSYTYIYIYIYICFSKLVHVPHIYIYSIGHMPKFVEYQIFEKFPELPSQFSPNMSSLWPGHIQIGRHVWLRARTCLGLGLPTYIRGMSAPPRTIGLFFLFHSISYGGQGPSRRFLVFSTESLQFL
jgi:hypothetical protein